jgi:hypothetical protein
MSIGLHDVEKLQTLYPDYQIAWRIYSSDDNHRRWRYACHSRTLSRLEISDHKSLASCVRVALNSTLVTQILLKMPISSPK